MSENRTAVAEKIALEARVFVRKARATGCSNLITNLAIQETAERLHIPGDRYSMRTVRAIIRRECAAMNETSLISF